MGNLVIESLERNRGEQFIIKSSYPISLFFKYLLFISQWIIFLWALGKADVEVYLVERGVRSGEERKREKIMAPQSFMRRWKTEKLKSIIDTFPMEWTEAYWEEREASPPSTSESIPSQLLTIYTHGLLLQPILWKCPLRWMLFLVLPDFLKMRKKTKLSFISCLKLIFLTIKTA